MLKMHILETLLKLIKNILKLLKNKIIINNKISDFNKVINVPENKSLSIR